MIVRVALGVIAAGLFVVAALGGGFVAAVLGVVVLCLALFPPTYIRRF